MKKIKTLWELNLENDLLLSGEDYRKLKPSFVIFICTFDLFEKGRHLYTFRNFCAEDFSLELGDETTKVFLNTKGILEDIDEEMKEFLAYIEETTDEFVQNAKTSLVRRIHNRVLEVKRNEEVEVEYMTLLERDRENQEIGREEATIENVRMLFQNGASMELVVASIKTLKKEKIQEIYDEVKNK